MRSDGRPVWMFASYYGNTAISPAVLVMCWCYFTSVTTTTSSYSFSCFLCILVLSRHNANAATCSTASYNMMYTQVYCVLCMSVRWVFGTLLWSVCWSFSLAHTLCYSFRFLVQCIAWRIALCIACEKLTASFFHPPLRFSSVHAWTVGCCFRAASDHILFFLFLFFSSHTFTSQLLDKPWSQVSSLLPPGSCLQFLSRIGFSNPTVRQFFIECCDIQCSLVLVT